MFPCLSDLNKHLWRLWRLLGMSQLTGSGEKWVTDGKGSSSSTLGGAMHPLRPPPHTPPFPVDMLLHIINNWINTPAMLRQTKTPYANTGFLEFICSGVMRQHRGRGACARALSSRTPIKACTCQIICFSSTWVRPTRLRALQLSGYGQLVLFSSVA